MGFEIYSISITQDKPHEVAGRITSVCVRARACVCVCVNVCVRFCECVCVLLLSKGDRDVSEEGS